MTTRIAVVGLALIASIGCDQTHPVSGPDPTPPVAYGTKPPIAAGVRLLRLFDVPSPFVLPPAGTRAQHNPTAAALEEAIPPEFQVFPQIIDRFVAVGWGGTSRLDGYAFMTFFANWAQQELELAVYRAGALVGRQTWVEEGSSFLPKQSGALTAGSLNVGISCGAVGNGNSRHAVEIRIFTSHGWSALARDNNTDSDVAEQGACPPPPTCELKPQTAVSSSERLRGIPSGAVTGSDFDQCAEPLPPGGGEPTEGSGGSVCYEVWLVYPGTGVEIYLGDICYEEYAT